MKFIYIKLMFFYGCACMFTIMDSRKNYDFDKDTSIPSSMGKRKSQPNLYSFLSKKATSMEVGCTSNDLNANKINVIPSMDIETTSMVQSHDHASGSGEYACVESNSNESNESSRRTTRKWHNQWTILHPWAYLSKTMINDERIRCSYCQEAKKINMYTKCGSSSIITCMKIMYFCALEDIPLDKYPSHCKLLRELDTPNIPSSDEYSSYVNAMSGKEMLMAIKDHVKMQLLCDICAIPFYSLLIDESTDRTIKKHLIVYILYVSNAGKGPTRCVFIELLSVEKGNAKSIFDIVNKFLQDNMLDTRKLIAIATDGAFVMVGHKTGVLARFQEATPHIIGVHCIAHRQALAATDGFVTHPHVYAFVDKVANKGYSWLGKSSKRHDELWKIMSEYDIVDMRALQTHSVR
ncbi:hypothetical protein KP509_05G100100 [Ceratopteris richardii]|uniref:C17orf113 probable zinc finger domain-containing protein n=1 Tax=Ceratopteris richardii TaxID=49495 RepID=A0A8T2URP4_CERRI|nr:hypothetical protein KP509_05G100100 [Ceratopteris richardii]